jgi:V/A-type H+-transporting ATPase subunit I
MSIVTLVHVAVLGPRYQKAQALAALQVLGRVHLERRADAGGAGAPAAPGARQALAFLLASPRRHHQVHDDRAFDAEAVQRRALAIRDRMRTLSDERDAVSRRIREVTPWGDFALPPALIERGLRLWFYLVPPYQLARIPPALVWQEVIREAGVAHVVVISPDEPRGMPVPRTYVGTRSLSELNRQLEAIETELDELDDERARLGRWTDLLARDLARLEDEAARRQAAEWTCDDDALFVATGWAPRDAREALEALCREQGLALVVRAPLEDEKPPTLLDNPPLVAGGQDLVHFYVTPAYRTWDPSIVVCGSFAVFFALILSDAGYALMLAVLLAVVPPRLRRHGAAARLWRVGVAGALVALLWGVAVGSWFGLAPAPDTVLDRMHLVDVHEASDFMRIALAVGLVHLIIANAGVAWRRRGTSVAVASVGWIVALAGGGVLWAQRGWLPGHSALLAAGAAAVAVGLAAVVLFSGERPGWWRRALDGSLALTRAVGAFGDVLSYLRLFALGFASASLARAFNDLAASIGAGMPGIGILVAGAVLVAGHGLNFVLSVASGVVHGLRLNFIEFFKWGVWDEGEPFRPFARREVTWTRS